MARAKLRPQREVVDRCRTLRIEVAAAVERLPAASADAELVDAAWHGEALGALLWALQLAELPPYDQPFHTEDVLGVDPVGGRLRPVDEIALERDSARLWHWRARTAVLQAAGTLELPARFASFDQVIAATAMRGFEQGLLPAPMRGDFRAFGKVYRHLSPSQLDEAHAIAAERHHALAWLAGSGRDWSDVPLDT
ncbi:MAG TPA: hypothetical protein VFA97_12390 [Gaiellaceae bacterium]|nr:hypothetical protein [Gaiellaceae bacterium]